MKKQILLFLLLLFVCLGSYAESCWDTVVQAMDEPEDFVFSNSEVVVTGTVDMQLVTTISYEDVRKALHRIEAVLIIDSVEKGNFQRGDRVKLLGKGVNCSCVYEFDVGGLYRLYARKDGVSNELTLVFCNFIKKISREYSE